MYYAIEIKQILNFPSKEDRDAWVKEHSINRTAICAPCIIKLKNRRKGKSYNEIDRYKFNLEK